MRTTTDPSDIAELILDCAALPDIVIHPCQVVPNPQHNSQYWQVSDECQATVAGMEDYGS